MIKFNRSQIFRHSVCLSVILIAYFISSSVTKVVVQPVVPPVDTGPEEVNDGKCDEP